MIKNSLSKMTLILVLMFVAIAPSAIIAAPLEEEGESAESVDRMQLRLKMLDRYLQVVESVHSIADDPEKSVVLQLQQLEDMYRKQRNPQKIITMYQDVLKNTSNQTVRNAASIKLSHLLQRAGRESEAEELTRKSLDENLKRLK
ncbi:MAG: hypothetical protein L0Z73_15580 [Gammaproteobacteria bacterium]|nr:hypothetical protein [Gammaproteobacteria bacterium]